MLPNTLTTFLKGSEIFGSYDKEQREHNSGLLTKRKCSEQKAITYDTVSSLNQNQTIPFQN